MCRPTVYASFDRMSRLRCFPLFVLLLLIAICSRVEPVLADKRVALVVGNAAYRHVTPLANPSNDARLIANTLRSLGFALTGGGPQLDLDESGLRHVVADFGNALVGADVALFYYAGHGVQLRGSNFLVPIDANPVKEADVDFQMLDANLILRQMESSGTRLNIVILDACRNNPFGGRGLRATAGGLAQMQAPEGTLISFATQPGNVALDGNNGHSPYSQALAEVLRRPGRDIFRTFNDVGLMVSRVTGGAQQPWTSNSPIKGDFYFSGPPIAASPPQPSAAPAMPADQVFWATIKDAKVAALFEEFLVKFPASPHTSEARARLGEIKAAQASPDRRPAGGGQQQASAAPELPNPQAPDPFRGAFRIRSDVSQGILNMRSGPGQRHRIVTAIPAGSGGVSIAKCRAPDDGRSHYRWCNAKWKSYVGWVSQNGIESDN